MGSTKAILMLAFIGFCCVLGVQSLRCYSCSGVNGCKTPAKYDCSSKLANDTRSYLSAHYKNVNVNHTSTSYQCLRDTIINNTLVLDDYKGCVYSNSNPCGYALADYYAGSHHDCKPCDSDYCNPAGRASTSLWTVASAVTFIAVLKYLTH